VHIHKEYEDGGHNVNAAGYFLTALALEGSDPLERMPAAQGRFDAFNPITGRSSRNQHPPISPA
jgi:hypothetical protein